MHLLLKIAEANVLGGGRDCYKEEDQKKGRINFSSDAAEEQPWASRVGEMQAPGPRYFSVGGSHSSRMGCSRRPSSLGLSGLP